MKLPARRAVLAVVSAVAATLLAGGGASASLGSDAGPAGSASPAGTGVPADYVFVHDPSMAREGGTYYLFSTGDPAGVIGNGNIQIRTSRDLVQVRPLVWTPDGWPVTGAPLTPVPGSPVPLR